MFHPDLRLLRSFAAVADEFSVTRAAERLHLTQPTVSGQIKELEQLLGFSLFHRTTRKVSLTLEGERLLPMVRDIISCTELLRVEVNNMQEDRSTHFHLGAAIFTLGFIDKIDLLDAFNEAFPEISYVIDNRMQTMLVPDLLTERLDISFLLGLAVPSMSEGLTAERQVTLNETQYPDSLERIVLRRRPIELLVPRDAALADFAIIPQAALRGQQIAMLSVDHGYAVTDPIEAFVSGCGAIPVTLAEGNAWAVERHAERYGVCGIGIGWFPVLPGLVQRPVEGMHFHLDFGVVLGSAANRAAKVFFDFAQKWQAERSINGLETVA